MAEPMIYKAITEVMKDVGAIGKDKTNTQQGWKFRGIDDVMNALNPAMVKNNVFCTPTVLETSREERISNKGQKLQYTVLKIKYTFYTTDGSSVECTVVGEAMDSGDKSCNKAMAVAMKYACFQTFCIPTEEMVDPDSETHTLETKEQEEKRKKMEPRPQAEPKYEAAEGMRVSNPADDTVWAQIEPNAAVTEEQLKRIKAEMERTGVTEKMALGAAKSETFEAMTQATAKALFNKLSVTKDKKK